MQEILTQLLQEAPRIVHPALHHVPDPAGALEHRYSPQFESDWMRVHDLLTERAKLSPHPPEINAAIHSIEEAAFKAVYSATLATDFTEFAPLVSDDFSLFAHAIARSFHDPWLSGLFHCYMKGQFPTGSISCVDVPIPVLLKVES